jgi:hypothetical protein
MSSLNATEKSKADDESDDEAQHDSHSDIQSHREKSDLLAHFLPDDGHSGQTRNKKAHKNRKHDELLFGNSRHQIQVVNIESLEHHDK